MPHGPYRDPACAFRLPIHLPLLLRSLPAPAADPAAPDLAVLTRDPAAALQSFFATVDRITAANPVAIGRLQELAGKARGSPLSEAESNELQQLKLHALRQGRAVGAVIGFFLKLRPYPMLEEIRARGKLFQPAFGPVLVVDGDTVRECARAQPGVHGRALRRRDGEGDVAGAQRRLHHVRPQHRRHRGLRAGQAPAVAGLQPAGRGRGSPASFTGTACGASARPCGRHGPTARPPSTWCRRSPATCR